MEEEAMTLTVTDENGNETECEVLFTFENDKTGKNYIVYTDYSLDEAGNTRIMASVYFPDRQDTPLLPIESEEELEAVERILGEIQLQAENGDI